MAREGPMGLPGGEGGLATTTATVTPPPPPRSYPFPGTSTLSPPHNPDINQRADPHTVSHRREKRIVLFQILCYNYCDIV